MLVKASDDIEDVLDVSTENLARLKEEAEMIEMDAVLRYIRIFSELSGQIRYASQKRIMIEMALIKLCKPAMEKNKDSILDRLREVEDKLENGVAVMPAGYEMSVQGGAVTSMPKEKPKLPKAIPEDVQTIVSKWPAIVGSAENPMKMHLRAAKLSLGGDNRLMVVLEDGIASDYFTKNEHNKQQLELLLSDFVGKEIEVNIQVVGNEREFEASYVDLSRLIQMDIEEEDF